VARTDYYDDPAAPAVNSIVPAVTAFVQDEHGRILMEQRSDNGRWGLPGGTHEAGESIAETVVREVKEETGITVEVVRMVGIYTNPKRVIAFSDGEVRQEFSICFAARPLTSEIRASSESFDVRWVSVAGLDRLDIAPTTRSRIEDALAESPQPRIA
jgi:8-oxo-dGTP pyrophosphatase MutT (NUDIX family)